MRGLDGRDARRLAAAATLGCLVALTGCGGGGTSTTPAAVDSPAAAPTPSPSPTRTPPTKEQDAADLKKVLVTAADLGKPWVQPKSVSSAGAKGKACPGHAFTAWPVKATAGREAQLTEGSGSGVNIASFTLKTLPGPDAAGVAAALGTDLENCAAYRDPSTFKLYVTRTAEGPSTLTGADEVLSSYAERLYYDKAKKKLAYARHSLTARQGRLVASLEYAFLTEKADPKAEDFTRVIRLLEKQLAKSADTFTG